MRPVIYRQLSFRSRGSSAFPHPQLHRLVHIFIIVRCKQLYRRLPTRKASTRSEHDSSSSPRARHMRYRVASTNAETPRASFLYTYTHVRCQKIHFFFLFIDKNSVWWILSVASRLMEISENQKNDIDKICCLSCIK